MKVDAEQHGPDRHRQRARESCAGDPERVPGAPSGNEHRGEQRVERDRHDLHDDGRLHDAGAAQGGAHGDQRELQRQTRRNQCR